MEKTVYNYFCLIFALSWEIFLKQVLLPRSFRSSKTWFWTNQNYQLTIYNFLHLLLLNTEMKSRHMAPKATKIRVVYNSFSNRDVALHFSHWVRYTRQIVYINPWCHQLIEQYPQLTVFKCRLCTKEWYIVCPN